MTMIDQITRLAETYSAAREALAGTVMALEDDLRAARSKYLPTLRRAIAKCASVHGELYAAIEGAPELFEKKKTLVVGGVRIGWRKSPGTIAWADADDVVSRIERHFPEQADALIAIKKVPRKDALANLSATELKRIGVEIVETSEAVFIKPTDTAVDRIVEKLLSEAEKIEA